jgi:hypothetical protein
MPNLQEDTMTTRGTPAPTCGAATRTGGTCKKPPLEGATRCRLHGGASPRAQAAAADRIAEQAAGRELARLGVARRDIHPAEALIELVQFTAAAVDYWRQRVTQLEEDELTWGRTTEVHKGSGEFPGTDTTSEAKPNIAYVMLERASDRLATYAAAALKAGVEERRVRLAESQGQLVAQAIRTILDQLNLTPAQLELVPTVVPAALRLIAGSAS